MNKSEKLQKYIQKIVKECLNESSMGKLSKDASDVLDGLTMRYKNKSAKDILKMIKLDPSLRELFGPEMLEMSITETELLSYIEDSQFIHNHVANRGKREGLTNLYMPNSVGDTEARNIKAI